MTLKDLLYPLRASFKKKEKCVSAQDLEGAFLEQAKTVWEWFGSELSFAQQKFLLDGMLQRCVGVLQTHILSSLANLTRRDPFEALPDELSMNILSFLGDDPGTLCRAARVNRNWRRLVDDNTHWYSMCLKNSYVPIGTPEAEQMHRMETAYENLWWGTTVANEQPRQIERHCWKLVYRDHHVERLRLCKNWRHGLYFKENVLAHTDEISCLAFDANRLVCGSYDCTLKVWNAVTNICLGTLHGHTDSVTCVAFNQNVIISGSLDTTLRVWNYATGECQRVLSDHEKEVECVCLRGTVAVSGSWDNTIRVWDILTGDCLRILRGHTGSVYCVQFDADKVISAGGDRMIRIWSMQSGTCVGTLQAHSDTITALQYDDRHVITGSYDGYLKTFDLRTGHCISSLRGHTGEVLCLQFDAEKIVSGGSGGNIKVWNRKTHKNQLSLKHTSGINCLQYDCRKIISGSKDHGLQLWDFGYIEEGDIGKT